MSGKKRLGGASSYAEAKAKSDRGKSPKSLANGGRAGCDSSPKSSAMGGGNSDGAPYSSAGKGLRCGGRAKR